MYPSKVELDWATKINLSDFEAVVVKVGADPPAQLIPENQVTVLLPVASWISLIVKICPVVTFETAKVEFPVKVTWWSFEDDISKVVVAP